MGTEVNLIQKKDKGLRGGHLGCSCFCCCCWEDICLFQEYKVKGIPNGILKILQKVKTNLGAFGYYFPKIHDCYLL